MGLLESGLWSKVLATHQIPFLVTEIPVEKSVALITFVSLLKRNYMMVLCRLSDTKRATKTSASLPAQPRTSTWALGIWTRAFVQKQHV